MSEFLSNCVDKYCNLAKISRASLRKVDTPFIDESNDPVAWNLRRTIQVVTSLRKSLLIRKQGGSYRNVHLVSS